MYTKMPKVRKQEVKEHNSKFDPLIFKLKVHLQLMFSLNNTKDVQKNINVHV